MKVKHCYYCDNEATTVEHVPPKCLFPEQKHLRAGENYRVNLITVPSCHEHNTKKSKDDEYLRLILLHGYFNNSVGKNHYNKGLKRALERRPAILAELFSSKTPIVVDQKHTLAVDVDLDRFNSIITHISKALCFQFLDFRWKGAVNVFSPQLLSMNDAYSDITNEINTYVSEVCVRELVDTEKRGENPDVFWCQIKATSKRLLIRMCFYGGFDIFAFSDPDLSPKLIPLPR